MERKDITGIIIQDEADHVVTGRFYFTVRVMREHFQKLLLSHGWTGRDFIFSGIVFEERHYYRMDGEFKETHRLCTLDDEPSWWMQDLYDDLSHTLLALKVGENAKGMYTRSENGEIFFCLRRPSNKQPGTPYNFFKSFLKKKKTLIDNSPESRISKIDNIDAAIRLTEQLKQALQEFNDYLYLSVSS